MKRLWNFFLAQTITLLFVLDSSPWFCGRLNLLSDFLHPFSCHLRQTCRGYSGSDLNHLWLLAPFHTGTGMRHRALLPPTPTHTHTRAHTHTRTRTRMRVHTHSLSHTHTHSLSLSLTHALSLSLTHTHTHTGLVDLLSSPVAVGVGCLSPLQTPPTPEYHWGQGTRYGDHSLAVSLLYYPLSSMRLHIVLFIIKM